MSDMTAVQKTLTAYWTFLMVGITLLGLWSDSANFAETCKSHSQLICFHAKSTPELLYGAFLPYTSKKYF